jgi:hypothetical protein
LGEKYKDSGRHREYRRHFDFSGLATIFFKIEQCTITYPKIKTFHSAVKDEQLAKFI